MTPHPLQSPAAFKEARHTLGLSCAGLAEALYISGDRTIRKWEHGDRPIPGPVAVALGLMLMLRVERR